MTGIAAQDGTVKSVVYIFDFNQEEPKAKFEFSDNLLLSIRCLESGNVAAIGNRGASIMIPAAQEKIDYDYQGKNPFHFSAGSVLRDGARFGTV